MSCLSAIAVISNYGFVVFHQCNINMETEVLFNLENLPANKVLACHIHEYGDLMEGCKTLGGHWNPLNRQHGSIFIDINKSHAGDLINNISTDENGKFQFKYSDPRIQLYGDVTESIFGRSVVIHYESDDLGLGGDLESLKTGNAGGRLACGIIGHMRTEYSF